MLPRKEERSFLDSNLLLALSSALLLAMLLASVFVVNPSLEPGGHALSWAQVQLQLAFTASNGARVLESWGPGAAERYSSVIWIDLLFALSYGLAFSLYARRMGGTGFWAIVPLLGMAANLSETSLEMYWVSHHSAAQPMSALFFAHSFIAALEWLIFPIFVVQMVLLFMYWLRTQAMEVAFRRPINSRSSPARAASLGPASAHKSRKPWA